MRVRLFVPTGRRGKRRGRSFLRSEGLFRGSILPRSPSLPLCRFQLRRQRRRHWMRVQYVGTIGVRQKPIRRSPCRSYRGYGGCDDGVMLLLLLWDLLMVLLVVVEERAQLIVIRFHLRKMCAVGGLTLQFFFSIFLKKKYCNEQKKFIGIIL